MPNEFKNDKAVNVGPSWVTLYTCPASTIATVIGGSMSNKLGTTVNVQSRMRDNDDGGAYVNLIGVNTPVDPGGALAPWGGSQKLVLEANDSIEVYASDTDSMDAVISVLEIS